MMTTIEISDEAHPLLDGGGNANDTKESLAISGSGDDDKERQGNTSAKPANGIIMSAFNLTNTVIGGGVVSLPYAFKSSGLIIGGIVLMFTFCLASVSLWLLRLSARESSQRTYHDIGKYAFGTKGVYASNIVQFLATAGVTISYFILIGDFLYPLVQAAAPSDLKDTFVASRQFIVLMTVVFEAPLILLRDIGKLAYASTLAIVAVFYLVTVVVFRSAERIDSGSFDECEGGTCFDFAVFTTGLFRALPLLTFAFSCQFNYFPIVDSLLRPTASRQAIMSNLSLGACTLIYMLIASFGYFTFYEKVNDNFLINYDDDDVLIMIARIGMTTVIACSYPLLSHPSIESLHEILFRGQYQTWKLRITYASGFLLVDAFVAWFNPDISIVFGLIGATASTTISFILPAIWYIGTMLKKTGRFPRNGPGACSMLLVVCGLVFMVIGTTVTLIPDEYLDPVAPPDVIPDLPDVPAGSNKLTYGPRVDL